MSHRPELSIGLVRFYSAEEIAKYLKDLTEFYSREAEKYGDKLGSMLREGPSIPKEEKKEKDDKKADPKAKKAGAGWTRMGPLLVSTADPSTATTEVMYQLHEELKQRLAKTTEALKSLEQNANAVLPKGATFQLYMRNGVPERIIIEGAATKKAVFNFEGRFKVV